MHLVSFWENHAGVYTCINNSYGIFIFPKTSADSVVNMPMLRALDVALIAVNAALYAAIGLLLYYIFPVVTPTIGGVKFWPVVVIPATFALLFGPVVGGVGAAIGIFISDMFTHGDPLLSLTAGVTSNFVCFALIGYLSHKNLNWRKTFLSLGVGVALLATLAYLLITPQTVVNYFNVSIDQALWNVYAVLVIFAVSYAIVIAVGLIRPKWRSFTAASVAGSIIGSAIIGLGVWGYTQFFTLPASIGGAHNLPSYAGLILFAWTFATEIPFMVILVPPIGEACYKAFPSLKPKQK
jgi:uncharacterized membrane protein